MFELKMKRYEKPQFQNVNFNVLYTENLKKINRSIKEYQNNEFNT
jgi:hypothetical protein